MAQSFVFRTDGGTHIGIGHVMRCKTLADALAQAGGQCHFLMRTHEGHLAEMIRAGGHGVTLLALDGAPYGDHPARPAHAPWLSGAWQADARASREAMASLKPDWLIVDHYALDATWEREVLTPGCRLLAIDDLADRPHLADVLLDQNLGRSADDYESHVPSDCTVFVGPAYALLRPEFAAAREAALERRKGAKLGSLLITLGGVDQDNVTGTVLEALSHIDLPKTLHVTVVMGASAPWLEKIHAQAAQMPFPVRVLADVSNMAELMTQADLCIGAAGSTAWERAALGLPTLLMVLADNQRSGAQALIATGAALDLPAGTALAPTLSKHLDALKTPAFYANLVRISTDLSEAQGVPMLCAHLSSARITLRKARMDDAQFVWRSRHEGEAWRYFKSPHPVALETHLEWFAQALQTGDLSLFIASSDISGTPRDIGYLRLDLKAGTQDAEISLSLAQDARAHGLGRALIAKGRLRAKQMGLARLHAVVHQDNAASKKAFYACGFHRTHSDGPFLHLRA